MSGPRVHKRGISTCQFENKSTYGIYSHLFKNRYGRIDTYKVCYFTINFRSRIKSLNKSIKIKKGRTEKLQTDGISFRKPNSKTSLKTIIIKNNSTFSTIIFV